MNDKYYRDDYEFTERFTHEELSKRVDDEWDSMSEDEQHSRTIDMSPTIYEYVLSSIKDGDVVEINGTDFEIINTQITYQFECPMDRVVIDTCSEFIELNGARTVDVNEALAVAKIVKLTKEYVVFETLVNDKGILLKNMYTEMGNACINIDPVCTAEGVNVPRLRKLILTT